MMYEFARTVFHRLRGSISGRILKNVIPVNLRWMLLQRLGRELEAGQVRSRVDDKTILLADYPRCGVNWLRFLVATVLHCERTGEFRKLSFAEMYEYAPTIADSGHFSPYRFNDGTSLLKTHTRYYPAFKQGIVIYRDPYEAMKSLSAITEWENGKVEIRPHKGLSGRQAFLLHWAGEFVSIHESWIKAISGTPDNFLVVRYEEMCRDAMAFIPAIFQFLRLDISKWEEGKIQELAGMYTRRHANWTNDEMLRYRDEKFEELSEDVSAKSLARINSVLEREVHETIRGMDDLRLRPTPNGSTAVSSVEETTR